MLFVFGHLVVSMKKTTLQSTRTAQQYLGSFVILLVLFFLGSGCHQAPSAQKLNYSDAEVEKVEQALAEYDWSEFEP